MGDTPNEKMSRVRNLIRFPATGKDRRIRLEESRDPRIRFVTKLRFVCGWLLAVGAFCFVLTHYGLFAPSAIQRTVQYALAGARQHEGDITNIEFENNIFSDGALFESGLAYADSDALYLSRPGSMTTFQVTIGYSNPVVESCQMCIILGKAAHTHQPMQRAGQFMAMYRAQFRHSDRQHRTDGRFSAHH